MELRPSEWSDGTATNTLAGAISEGQLPTDVMRNDLKNAAVRLAPEIDEILTVLSDVLSKIVRLEKFGEIIVKVKQVYEAQRKLLEDTKTEHVRKIETMIGDDIFDED